MKNRRRFITLIIILVIVALLIFGGVLAFVLINNAKNSGKGGGDEPAEDVVVLRWGESQLVNIEDLKYGEERGEYKLQLIADKETSEEFIGTFYFGITSDYTPSTYSILDYLYVEVYNNTNKEDLLFSITPEDSIKSKEIKISISEGISKDLYFYVGMVDINPHIYSQIKDSALLYFDWSN